MTDLFLNKSQQLTEWMKNKKIFSTHDVILWGCQNYYNRANRTKQELWNKGIIRTLTDFQKQSKGYNCKDDCYEWVGKEEFAGVATNGN